MNKSLLTVLVIVVIAIVGWVAYQQGSVDNEQDIEINLPGTENSERGY